MKWVKRVLPVLLIVFIIVQFIQPARNESGQAMPSDISHAYSIPDSIYTMLKNACFDCHSNNTIYPWYSGIQPIGWLIGNDIDAGKSKLNFNELGSLSQRRQISKLRGIENRIKDGTMPLPAYQFMHESGRLSDDERKFLITWIQKVTDDSL